MKIYHTILFLCLLINFESVVARSITKRLKANNNEATLQSLAITTSIIDGVKNVNSARIKNDNKLLFYRGGDAEKRCIMHPLFFMSSMAALAGCSHVLCMKRFQCYAAMMTGNIIGFGVALAEGDMNEARFRFDLLASFFSGTIGARTIESRSPSKDKHHKVVAQIAIGMFAIADRIPDDQRRKLMILSAAYGVVYATANKALNATITQLMTGHLTKLGSAISDRSFNAGTAASLNILASFTCGCAIGARLFMAVGHKLPIFTIIGAIYAVLLLLFRG